MKKPFALFILLACLTHGYAQTGNHGLDLSFGKEGIVIDTQRSFFAASDLALQTDGKIIVVGYEYLARYLPNGKPDSTFGGRGLIAVTKLTDSNGGYASHVFVLPDSKLLVTVNRSKLGDVIMRLKPDGTFDSTYGTNGKTAFCCGEVAAALQPDGKLVTVGVMNHSYAAVHRFTADGRIDSTFGSIGRVLRFINTNGNIAIAGIGTLADGRIAVAGSDYHNAYYLRYHSDGRPDKTLGPDGICYPIGTTYCDDAIIYPDGKVLVALGGLDFDNDARLARINEDGKPDSTYGINGILAVPGLQINAFVQMQDGRIFCGGSWDEHFAVARILKDGVGIDATFGSAGIQYTTVSGALYERVYAVALQPDGKFIAGGQSRTEFTPDKRNPYHASIVRYLPDAPVRVFHPANPTNYSLQIFPNPASTTLYVQAPGNGILRLSTTTGKLLQQSIYTGPISGIDIAGLPPGSYILSLQNAAGIRSSIFIKE